MKEDRNEAYQRLHGFKPLKRTSKKQGETDWFYFDPRGARTVSDMKKINVESEISVNPMIKEILAYDMTENPEDYYIWRTKDDDKVRSSHAARDGKIFNYNVPPEGGNPGEDYNCRCWAEPYHPNKNKQSDVAKVDLSGLPQYVGNISDDELLEKMWNNIKAFEGVISYPYIDSKGYITIGGGSNIDNYDDFMKVNFTVNGYPVTDTQKLMVYNKLRDLSNQKDAYGNYINRNRTADSFLNDTNLQISEQDAYNMHEII